MKQQQIIINWQPRQQPLIPSALVATGLSAQQLGRRLLNYTEQQLALLRGIAGDGLFLLLAAEQHLPWLPGLQYLGVATEAPNLLLPSNLEPDAPCALLQQALLHKYPCAQLAVVAGSKQLLVVDYAQMLQKELLQSWLKPG